MYSIDEVHRMSVFLHGWPTHLDKDNPPVYTTCNSDIKLSIVIPTLNQADTLEHTLLSIINQDYRNFEIIIIDGGSRDHTMRIVEKYHEWIYYFMTGQDNGQSDAINKGFDKATGKIYAWINSDDYYLPSAFSKVIKMFSESIDILVGAGDIVTKDCRFLKHIHPMKMEQKNLIRWTEGDWIMQQSCFWTSRIWNSSGGVDESLSLLMDFDLWFRFSTLGRSLILNEPLAAMRYYPEIKTISLRDRVKEETAYVFAKNGEFNEVRRIVKELVADNKILLEERDKRYNGILSRFFKRVGIDV